MTTQAENERLDDLEQAVAHCAELIRHMGQTLSWSSAGQRLNNPPPHILKAQQDLQDWFVRTDIRRMERFNSHIERINGLDEAQQAHRENSD